MIMLVVRRRECTYMPHAGKLRPGFHNMHVAWTLATLEHALPGLGAMLSFPSLTRTARRSVALSDYSRRNTFSYTVEGAGQHRV
jgi:hypothetical protein